MTNDKTKLPPPPAGWWIGWLLLTLLCIFAAAIAIPLARLVERLPDASLIAGVGLLIVLSFGVRGSR